MLVIRIEKWPFGNKNNAQLIGVCKIANDGTGTQEQGNYEVALTHSDKYFGRKGIWKTGVVKGFNRKKSSYHLLYLALKACLYPRKGDKA